MAPYILALGFLLLFLYTSFYPYKLPRNIPRIPLWITIYDTFYGTSRVDFYNKHVRDLAEKHGAVIIWHIGRWSVHITKPEYLMQMFRDDASFPKGGSFMKVPWGPLSKLFGQNIIDSSGQLWKQQRNILQPAIKRQFDIAYMKQKSSELRATLWRDYDVQDKDRRVGIDIDEHMQHWALSIYCKYFMGINLESVPDIENRLTRFVTARKKGFMGGITMLFPFLQRFPWGFPSNRRAFTLVKELEEILLDIARLDPDNESDADGNTVKDRLNSARRDGAISDFHYLSNMKQLFIAGFENVEAVLLSAIAAMATNPSVQSTLHAELASLVPTAYNLEDLDRLPVLLAVILEALRLYPPLSSLTNRYTAQQTLLGEDINLPAGTWIGWNSYAVQTDARIWGSDALEFRPSRWGEDIDSINAMFRAQQAKAVFIPFSSRSRTCLGVSFVLMQLKIVLYELFSELEWSVCDDRMPTMCEGAISSPTHCRFTPRARKRQTIP
ncbi:cytochrome P450 [Trichoderma pleuroticola]